MDALVGRQEAPNPLTVGVNFLQAERHFYAVREVTQSYKRGVALRSTIFTLILKLLQVMYAIQIQLTLTLTQTLKRLT